MKAGSTGRFRGLFAIGLACAWWVSLLLASLGTQDAAAAQFCKPRRAVDYLAPIRQLPPIKRFPNSGQLPFAPNHVEEGNIGPSRVVPGGGAVGVVVSGTDRQHLGWKIEGHLTRILKNGHTVGSSRRHLWFISGLPKGGGAWSLAFQVGARPALYRYDATFRNRSGDLLGRFAEYFRVVKRTVKVKLRLQSDVYAPGEMLTARLVNDGTMPIFYGFEALIEKWTGGEWSLDPTTPSWPLEGLGLGGGVIGMCERFPLVTTPGDFRLTKRYSVSIPGKQVPVRAYFTVG